MPSIFFKREPSQQKIPRRSYRTGIWGRKHSTVIHRAETVRAISEGQATPATPAFSTNTPMRLPTTLMILETKEIFMVIRVLPKLRHNAAPAL